MAVSAMCCGMGYAHATFLRRLTDNEGKPLVLKAHGHEDMPKLIEGLLREEFGGEIDGEACGVGVELFQKRGAVQRGNQADQIIDLGGL